MNIDFKSYYKYGSHIPKSITDSKNYWKAKYLNLLAIIAQVSLLEQVPETTRNIS